MKFKLEAFGNKDSLVLFKNLPAGNPGSILGVRKTHCRRASYPLQYSWASLVAQTVKNPSAMRGLDSIPGVDRSPGGGHGNSLQYSCLENPHRDRSLAGYSPWGLKEWDMTERLSTARSRTVTW